jgi:hypothetical protein
MVLAVTALGMVCAHNHDNFIPQMTGIDNLADFIWRSTWFHIEPMSIGGWKHLTGYAGEANARKAFILSLEAIERPAGCSRFHDVVDMARDAV